MTIHDSSTTCDVIRFNAQYVFDVLVARTSLACEQALRGTLAAGREKEGELATTALEFEFHLQFPCGFPSTELSDFRQSACSGNELECKQTLKNTCQG